MFYGFILSMWVMRKVDEAWVRDQATKGRITAAEAEMILATPQNQQ